jgi:hypothetical protein
MKKQVAAERRHLNELAAILPLVHFPQHGKVRRESLRGQTQRYPLLAAIGGLYRVPGVMGFLRERHLPNLDFRAKAGFAHVTPI